MSIIGRSLIFLLMVLAFAGMQRCQGVEEPNLDSLVSTRRTANRIAAAAPNKFVEEDIAQQLPSPSETTLASLNQMRVDKRLPAGPAPRDYSSEFFADKILADSPDKPLRNWAPTEFYWEAAGVVHRPLYFDDQRLEVNGCSAHPRWQPALSAVRFFGAIPTFPLRVLQTPSNKHVQSVGLPPNKILSDSSLPQPPR